MSKETPPYPDTKPKSTRLPPRLEEMIDELVKAGLFLNGAEVIREGIRDTYHKYQTQLKGGS